jgi:ribosome-associated protein
MLVGDYQIANKGDTVVDTKYGMNEVESNLIHDHERFRNECILAQEAGIKLFVLIQDEKITQLGEVFSWYNIRRKWSKNAVTGRTLGKIMYSMQEKYGVTFVFCKKSDIGHRIIELLEVSD